MRPLLSLRMPSLDPSNAFIILFYVYEACTHAHILYSAIWKFLTFSNVMNALSKLVCEQILFPYLGYLIHIFKNFLCIEDSAWYISDTF